MTKVKVKAKAKAKAGLSQPLNLRDRRHFPLFKEVSPNYIIPNTVLLLEITSKDHRSTIFNAIDQLGSSVYVQFQFKNPKEAIQTLTSLQPGVVVAIRDAVREPTGVAIGLMSGIVRPATGAGEILVHDMSNVDILPCSLDVLMTLSDSLQLRTDPIHHVATCQNCSEPTSQCCVKCGTLFCTKKCQAESYEDHENECKSLQMILQWSVKSNKIK